MDNCLRFLFIILLANIIHCNPLNELQIKDSSSGSSCSAQDDCYKEFFSFNNYCCKSTCCNWAQFVFQDRWGRIEKLFQSQNPDLTEEFNFFIDLYSNWWSNFVVTIKNPRVFSVILALVITSLVISIICIAISLLCCLCSCCNCCKSIIANICCCACKNGKCYKYLTTNDTT